MTFRRLKPVQARLVLTEFTRLYDFSHPSHLSLIDETSMLGYMLNRLKTLKGVGLGDDKDNNEWCSFNALDKNQLSMHGLEDIVWWCNDLCTIPDFSNALNIMKREKDGIEQRAGANRLFFDSDGNASTDAISLDH